METNKTPEEILDAIIGEIRAENKDEVWYSDAIEAMKEYGKQQYNQAIKDAAENAEVKQIELPKTYDPRPCFKWIVDKDSILKLLKQ